MGVTFFSDEAPMEFGVFSRAWITLFRITCGESERERGGEGEREGGGERERERGRERGIRAWITLFRITCGEGRGDDRERERGGGRPTGQINPQIQDQTNCKQFYSFSSSASFITQGKSPRGWAALAKRRAQKRSALYLL